MKNPHPDDFPLNEDAKLAPTKALYVSRHNDEISVTEVPADPGTDLLSLTHDQAKDRTADHKPFLKFHHGAWYARTFQALDESEHMAVEMSGPVLEYGHWTLTFPPQSPHSTHEIHVRPCGLLRREDYFVQESVTFFWDMEGSGQCTLWKVVEGKRVEAAKYARHGPSKETGLLLVDEEMVDLVVCVATCVATLKRIDSFRK